MNLLNSTFIAVGDNGVQLAGDIKEVIWGSAAFFVIFALGVWKAGPLIVKGLKDRTARIEGELLEARHEREAAQQALTESDGDLPDVEAEKKKILIEAHNTAARLKVDLVDKAEADAEEMRARARADVTSRHQQARADLEAEVSSLTRETATAVVIENLDQQAQIDLIENYINQVGQTS